MTSKLQFELFMRALRLRALPANPKQLAPGAIRCDQKEDIGSARLSRIEAALKETRADRAEE